MMCCKYAPVYTYSKFVSATRPPSFELPAREGLFAYGVVPSGVRPGDLPPWYVPVEVGKVGDCRNAPVRFGVHAAGYVSARGVQGLLYVPAYCVYAPVRFCKADALFVSYSGPVGVKRDALGVNPHGYDCAVCGPSITAFVQAVRKRSSLDVSAVEAEMNRAHECDRAGLSLFGRHAYVFAPYARAS